MDSAKEANRLRAIEIEREWIARAGISADDPDFSAKAKSVVAERYREIHDAEGRPEPTRAALLSAQRKNEELVRYLRGKLCGR